MSTHRQLDGVWATCRDVGMCGLLFHVELSVMEAELLPLRMLLPLFEVVQPPENAWNLPKTKEWGTLLGGSHRDYDLPAIVGDDGTLEWYQHNKAHRLRGPARIFPDGTQEWWQENQLHREDGPARITGEGEVEWWWKGARIFTPSQIAAWRPYLTRYGFSE